MKWWSVLLISLFLLACEDLKTDDLVNFVVNTKTQQHVAEDKLPMLIYIAPLTFTQQQARSPFFKPKRTTITIEDKKVAIGCLQPDFKREKEILERFSLGDLQMRGTLKVNQQLCAIIATPNELFYKVKVEDYLGLNHGQITHVSEGVIKLTELKLGEDSCWEKQATEIKLLLE